MTKQIKSAISLFVCLCAVLSLVSCAITGKNSSAINANNVLKVYNVEAKALEAPRYSHPSPNIIAAARAANDFAFRLSAELVKNVGYENFVCSPYSVWLPLAALVNATDAKNKPALLDALGAAGVSEDDINRAASRMLYDLTKLRDKEENGGYGYYYNPLKIAKPITPKNHKTLKEL